MRDPERRENTSEIERRISPLVVALNNCRNTRTFGSCQGHFGFEEPEPLNKMSYIEFRMPKDKFRGLEQFISHLLNVGKCRVEFENHFTDEAYFYGCIYIIPNEKLEPAKQREVVDETISIVQELC